MALLAKSLDVSLKEPQGVSPSEMWRLLQKQRSHRSITICDENEIWLVAIYALRGGTAILPHPPFPPKLTEWVPAHCADSALYFLASTAGTEQLAVHKGEISLLIQ
ncbi:hypothetical protein TELCIR_14788 [Teladorsagia circumcincta]|uniref:Uncharacterized protein n=1 Tax=Teladorsagia circumcincta TaxID=45464 RepID=A0A2G9U000_TELCI|nr:hypothetical protein TELCIR_14788 [Teladorsagia circumcincta]